MASSASAEPIIRVEKLLAQYGSKVILKDVSFDVQQGEVFGIVGGSGCGKTTLMRHMIGLQRPAGGRVLVSGEDVGDANEDQLQRIRRKIGMAYQSGALFASLNLGENVALPLEEFTTLSSEMVALLVRIKLSMVNLDGFENFQIAELSGGMKKRAGLARAMALDPDMLFFDEPSAGLDPVTSAELDELIGQINRSLGTTIVVVTHELASIFAIADRVIMLDGETKNIIATGSPKELQKHHDPRVHAFFNREPRADSNGGKEDGHRGT